MTQDNKTETIILRVEPSLKADLQRMADMDERKLADFVRLQLKKIVDTSKKKK
jgi:hypothetical protein